MIPEILLMTMLTFNGQNVDMVDTTLYYIMMAESSGQEIQFHPDKKSYGLFGLTEVACFEVGEAFPPASPLDELKAARKYLELMMKRHECDVVDAAGYYHGGDEKRRLAYLGRLAKIDPQENQKQLTYFVGLLKKEAEEK